jgi:hypothetical protein
LADIVPSNRDRSTTQVTASALLTLDILALLALPAAVINVKALTFSRPMMPGERWAWNPVYAAFAAL